MDSARRDAARELQRALGEAGATRDGSRTSTPAANGASGTAGSEGAVSFDAAALHDQAVEGGGAASGLPHGGVTGVTGADGTSGRAMHGAGEGSLSPEETAVTASLEAPFGAAGASTSADMGGDASGSGSGTGQGSGRGSSADLPGGAAASHAADGGLSASASGSSTQPLYDLRALAGAGLSSDRGGTEFGGTIDAARGSILTTAPAEEQAAQIVRSMRFQWRGPVGEAQLRLTPEHLGQVLVSVRVEHGTVNATLHADTPGAQQWIQAHQQQLRDALDAQGLRVAHLHVTSDPEDRPRRDRDQEDARQPRSRSRQPTADAGRDAGDRRFEIRV